MKIDEVRADYQKQLKEVEIELAKSEHAEALIEPNEKNLDSVLLLEFNFISFIMNYMDQKMLLLDINLYYF